MEKYLSQVQKQWIEETWKKLDQKLSVVAVRSKDKIPFQSHDHMHDDTSKDGINCWTNGFWPGLMWLMYVGTKKDCYRQTAEHIEQMLDKAFENHDKLSHDVGFIWRLASGPDYALTGNEKAKTRQSYAADHLMSRFNVCGEYIRAWSGERQGESTVGFTIIDTMMNLPILYWASREYNDPRFRFVAMKHADNTMANHIRPDGSVRHIVVHNPETGEIEGERGGQGYSVGSAWSRGQSWAVYGFALSYLHTGKQEYLDTAKRAAHYFIANVCDNYLPALDFRAPKGEGLYDSSAGMVTACGLLEIAGVVPEHEKSMYINAAMNLLMTMEKEWADWSKDTDFIVDMASGSYASEKSHNHNIIYTDYYFAEALYKLKGLKPLFW